MLKGTLDDFTLPEILRFLAAARKTGCVEVSRTAGDGRVFLREGSVYYAESSRTRGLDQVLDETAVRTQIDESFFDLLRWEAGEFNFSPNVEVEPGFVVDVEVENLIAETSQKLEELGVIAEKIPNEDAVLAMSPTPPSDAEINIRSEEWRVLVLVNGDRSVTEIADQVGQDSFTVMRTLYGLASTGLIEVVYVQEPDGKPAAAPEVEPEAAAVEVELDQDDATDVAATNGMTPDAYLESLASPLAGAELVQEMEAEFPPFDESDVSDDAIDGAEEPVLDEEVDALPLGLAAGTDSAETAAPITDEDLPTAEPVTHEDEPTAEPVTYEDQPTADLEGAQSPAEPADIPIEESNATIVDRLAAVKELADLFDPPDTGAVGTPYPAELAARAEAARAEAAAAANGDGRKRVEDDEEITRGLISRLIDGVKGL